VLTVLLDPAPPAAPELPAFLGWLGAPSLVSVAGVRGPLNGRGLSLALACDVRILTTDAVVQVPERCVALAAPLASLAGPAVALELCATGRRVAAAEAVGLGLATLVVPAAELEAAVADFAAAVLARPRDDLVETKALLRAHGSAHSWAPVSRGEPEALARLEAEEEESTTWT
jgi:enoyl-CoA hydratase/carnithine racemase